MYGGTLTEWMGINMVGCGSGNGGLGEVGRAKCITCVHSSIKSEWVVLDLAMEREGQMGWEK